MANKWRFAKLKIRQIFHPVQKLDKLAKLFSRQNRIPVKSFLLYGANYKTTSRAIAV